MIDLLCDVAYGWRMLVRYRGFALAAVLTLALGIGVDTTLFSVVDAVLLRPLPYPQADRLVMLWASYPKGGYDQLFLPGADYLDFRRGVSAFEDLGAYRLEDLTLTGGGEPENLEGVSVTPSLLAILGARTAVGRSLIAGDDDQGGNPVAVLSYDFWQRRFAGDPAIVGRKLTLSGGSYEVVGVLRRGLVLPPFTLSGQTYSFEREAGVYLPLAREELSAERRRRTLLVLGRLRPGFAAQAANRQVVAQAERLAEMHPDTHPADLSAFVVPLQEQAVRLVRPTLLLLLGGVGLILLIVCANIANLLLVRATGRGREIAVRAALGASRGRLVRQLLIESGVLALTGAAVGAGLAVGGARWVAGLQLDWIPRLAEARIDGRALLFSLLAALATGLLFGLAPALYSARSDVAGRLQGTARTAGGGSGRLQQVLVIFELALSLSLLAGAGLMLKSFYRLQTVDPGFQRQGILTAEISLPAERYPDGERIRGTVEEMVERLRALPGVRSAAAASSLPLSALLDGIAIRIEGAPPAEGEPPVAVLLRATPGYLPLMGVSCEAGRGFRATDGAGSAPVVLISEAFAQRFWAGREPVGKRLALGRPGAEAPVWRTVVGVVGDVRLEGLNQPAPPTVYVPFAQDPSPRMVLAVAGGGGAGLTAELRRSVWSVDPDLPLEPTPLREVVARTLVQPRLSSVLLGALALMALVLGAIGVYGVVAFTVASRRQEIAVRIALGAKVGEVRRMILRNGLILGSIGIALGLVGAHAVGRLLSGMLFGVGANDATILALVAAVLLAATLSAAYLPARQASREQPSTVLRQE